MQPATVAMVYGKLSDPELAQRIASGDKDAFELLMRRHNQILYRTARSILKDDAEAEDAAQEAWLLAYRAIGNFRGDAKLSTWLVRIVVNEAIGRARKRSARFTPAGHRAVRFAGRPVTSERSASTPPADGPTTTRSRYTG